MSNLEQQHGRPLRVFVAGGSGVVGRALIPKLVDKGYDVTAMTRTPGKADAIRDLGATPILCNVFDQPNLMRVVVEAKPEVVINQLTELPKRGLQPKKLDEYYARNDRVRREGTDNLLAAARASGVRRYIGQSFAAWYEPTGGMVKDVGDRLWLDAPSPIGEAVRALEHSEDVALNAPDIEGVILRFGTLYGPETWYAPDGEIGRQMKERKYPNIGSGEGMTSFIHVDDAADACVAFVESGIAGVYNVVDDEPAMANEWMPAFAESVGAKSPRRVPAWLARLIAGKALVEWSTRSRGASNRKMKHALGWRPRYETWRRGFEDALT
jgi:2-alkyl-3-oxoalkanoate reductase